MRKIRIRYLFGSIIFQIHWIETYSLYSMGMRNRKRGGVISNIILCFKSKERKSGTERFSQSSKRSQRNFLFQNKRKLCFHTLTWLTSAPDFKRISRISAFPDWAARCKGLWWNNCQQIKDHRVILYWSTICWENPLSNQKRWKSFIFETWTQSFLSNLSLLFLLLHLFFWYPIKKLTWLFPICAFAAMRMFTQSLWLYKTASCSVCGDTVRT